MRMREMLDRTPKSEGRTRFSVDYGALIGLDAGEMVLTWQRPAISDLFSAYDAAERIRERHPRWPERMCLVIASMAVAHVSPMDVGDDGLGVGEFYEALAEAHEDAFAALMAEWHRVMQETEAALVAARKTGRGPAEAGPDSVHAIPAPAPA